MALKLIESNKQTYGIMRQLKREFIVADSIYLIVKLRVKTDSLFRGSLGADCFNSFKGYSDTFPAFLPSLKVGGISELKAGPVHVELKFPVVSQIWSEVKTVLQLVNGAMKLFLKMFGIVKGNGLLPFLKDFK